MTWNQTHQRTQVLREIEASLAATQMPTTLAWQPSYDALFGDREGLVAWLRYRWQLRLADPELDATHPALATARSGLAMLHREEARRAAA